MKLISSSSHFIFVLVCLFFISFILAFTLPAAADDCEKTIIFKNQGAYTASAGILYRYEGRNVTKETGNLAARQEKSLSVPCSAINVRMWAKAVPGNDILSVVTSGLAADRCFVLKGASSNPGYEICQCYKTITFKNEGGYIAKAEVYYKSGGSQQSVRTGNFNRGQERHLRVPCEATDVRPVPNAVSSIYAFLPGYTFYKAEDRCFLLKGTTGYLDWQSCDPPGTPPIYSNHCYKYVTIKNESAYSAYGDVYYTVNGERAKVHQSYRTGLFSHGQVKRFPIPCEAGSHIRIGAFESDYFLEMNLPSRQDHCFILRGTQASPRYELCTVEGQTHSISIRNHGAYSTELSVAYDYNGMRLNPKDMIHAGQNGSVSIPIQSTNVHIKAKAVAGKTIISTTIPNARTICWEVRGTTLNPRSAYCP